MNVICFDLEGPLSPQDNAYEVMKLVKEGDKIFEVISRYDDLLTLEHTPNYEPGDTLALIVPFLLLHKISESDIRRVSDRAKIVNGAKYMISRLKSIGWDVYIISTSYEQHALNIGEKIGVFKENIACTQFPLDKYLSELETKDFSAVEKVETKILNELYPQMNDKKIKEELDKFFWEELPKTDLGRVMGEMTVVGGKRKVDAVYEIIRKTKKELKDILVVGDSITDYKMLMEVRENNGVSIVFNGNEYCIPHANIGLASSDMRSLMVVTDAYVRGGRETVIKTVKTWEKMHDRFAEDPGDIPSTLIPGDIKNFLAKKQDIPPHFHYLENAGEEKQANVLKIHKKAREFVRGSAAKLG